MYINPARPLSPGFNREGCPFHFQDWKSSLKRDPEIQSQKKRLNPPGCSLPVASFLNKETTIKKRLGQLTDHQLGHLIIAMQRHGLSEIKSFISKYNLMCFYFIFHVLKR